MERKGINFGGRLFFRTLSDEVRASSPIFSLFRRSSFSSFGSLHGIVCRHRSFLGGGGVFFFVWGGVVCGGWGVFSFPFRNSFSARRTATKIKASSAIPPFPSGIEAIQCHSGAVPPWRFFFLWQISAFSGRKCFPFPFSSH